MEIVYVLGNSVSLNRKLDTPRTARDEKRRATHNEGKLGYPNDFSVSFTTQPVTRFDFDLKHEDTQTKLKKYYSVTFVPQLQNISHKNRNVLIRNFHLICDLIPACKSGTMC